jgi:hypothetical protein
VVDFFQAIIEGFYGRQWSWSQRAAYASFIKSNQYQAYIYAPKGDVYLRSRWRESWPQEVFQNLLDLSQCYAQQSVDFGIGFSPMGLFGRYGKEDVAALKNKVTEINRLKPKVLCILFDDMKGDVPNLASRQLKIIKDVLAVSEAQTHIVCPSYYSFDPVLETLFGSMPANYLGDLAAGLPHDMGFFWTGDKVISQSLSSGSLLRIESILGRKPILWDNVLANDGRLTSDYLPLEGADYRHENLLGLLSGSVVNPMNQPAIAKVVLQEYTDNLHGCVVPALDSEASAAVKLLLRDKKLFVEKGLQGLSAESCQQLIEEYTAAGGPIAFDVVDWLQGGYCFDPACLTG